MKKSEAYTRLMERGIRPSMQRLAIMDYLINHPIHPTIDDVYQALSNKVPTLSRTTVYNTLRMLSENQAAQMITIDEHRVCYDGNVESHVHFYCKKCGKITRMQQSWPTSVANSHLQRYRSWNVSWRWTSLLMVVRHTTLMTRSIHQGHHPPARQTAWRFSVWMRTPSD